MNNTVIWLSIGVPLTCTYIYFPSPCLNFWPSTLLSDPAFRSLRLHVQLPAARVMLTELTSGLLSRHLTCWACILAFEPPFNFEAGICLYSFKFQGSCLTFWTCSWLQSPYFAFLAWCLAFWSYTDFSESFCALLVSLHPDFLRVCVGLELACHTLSLCIAL